MRYHYLAILIVIGAAAVIGISITSSMWDACREHHGMVYCSIYVDGGWAWGMSDR